MNMLVWERRLDSLTLRSIVPPLVVLGTLLASFLAGRLQVMMPVIGPALLVGVVFIPLLLMIELKWLVIGILILTLCSRLLSLVGAPPVVNYAHFGLMLLAIVNVALRRVILHRQSDPLAIRIYIALVLLAGLTVSSALINGWHALRPIVFWLMFAEPFLILAFMLDLEPAGREQVRRVLLFLALLQIPFALAQFAQHGTSDFVKGTMIDQGAGHHILGALGVMGAFLFIVGPRREWWGKSVLLVVVPLLLSLGILSDAKQVFAALAVAAVPFVLPMVRTRLPMVLIAAPLLIGLVVVGVSVNSSMQKMTDRDEVESRLDQKRGHFERVIDEMGAVGWWIGAGPGNGLSRVALLTFPSYGNVPEFLVGSPPPLAIPFVEEEREKISRKQDTSAGSPFSSVLSVFSELGIVGCIVYVFLGRLAWKAASECPPLERSVCQTLLIMALVLGAIFNWLEEPVFTLYLAAMIGSLRLTSDTRSPKNDEAMADTYTSHWSPFTRYEDAPSVWDAAASRR